MATKSCVTCFLKPPKPGTVQELVVGDRGLFCDTCFIYLHDLREMSLEELPLEDKLSKTMINERTKDAYLVGQSIHVSDFSNFWFRRCVCSLCTDAHTYFLLFSFDRMRF